MVNEKRKQEMQDKYLKVELLNRVYEQLCNQIDFINIRTQEIHTLKGSLDKLDNTESYSQLGSGIFVVSKITDKNNFLVNVGRKLYVKMSRDELEKFLDRRLSDLQTSLSKLVERKKELEIVLQKKISELQSF